MRTRIHLLLVVLQLTSRTLWGQTLAWQNTYNGPNNFTDESIKVARDSAGSTYVTGVSQGDIATIKYNLAGAQEWIQRYDVAFFSDLYGDTHTADRPTDMVVDGAGNVYVTGSSYYIGSNSYYTAVTVKYNSSGTLLWKVEHTSPNSYGEVQNSQLGQDATGHVYVAFTYDRGRFQQYIVVEKLTPAGSSVWKKQYQSPNYGLPLLRKLHVTAQGNLYLSASLLYVPDSGGPEQADYLTVKYTNAGSLQWQATYGSTTVNNDPVNLATDQQGNVYVTGTSGSAVTTLKYNNSGQQQWEQSFTIPYTNENGFEVFTDTRASDLLVDSQGSVYVAGTAFYESNCRSVEGFTMKYSPAGQLVWRVTNITSYCDPAVVHSPKLGLDSAGYIYFIADYSDYGYYLIHLRKLTTEGQSVWKQTYQGEYLSIRDVYVSGSGEIYMTGSVFDGGSNYLTIKYVPALPTLRINSGGPTLTTTIGLFSADNAYTGVTGSYSAKVPIGGTTDDELYQSYRRTESYNKNVSFSYSIPVTNGTYTVKLHFAEIYHTAAGQRKFNVSAEGTPWLSSYDIVADAGVKTAVVKTKNVTVNDGKLTLTFTSLVDRACVSAIEILPPTGAREEVKAPIAEAVESRLQAYPNPFSNQVTVHFTAQEAGNAQLDLYDLQGKLVRSLWRESVQQGQERKVEVEGKDLQAGLYLLRLTNGSHRNHQKLLLQR